MTFCGLARSLPVYMWVPALSPKNSISLMLILWLVCGDWCLSIVLETQVWSVNTHNPLAQQLLWAGSWTNTISKGQTWASCLNSWTRGPFLPRVGVESLSLWGGGTLPEKAGIKGKKSQEMGVNSHDTHARSSACELNKKPLFSSPLLCFLSSFPPFLFIGLSPFKLFFKPQVSWNINILWLLK